MANIKGVAKWAKLGIPKDNYDKFDDRAVERYLVNVYVSDESLTKFKDEVSKVYEAAKEDPSFFRKGKPVDFTDKPTLPFKTDEDGKEYIVFQTHAFNTDKETKEVTQKTFPLFDKSGGILEKQVGNGSKVNVSYGFKVYRFSEDNSKVVAYMNAILVEELVEFGGGSAAAFGFDVEKPADAFGFNGTGEEVPI